MFRNNKLINGTTNIIGNFILGWVYFIFGLVISIIMTKYIYPNHTPKNTPDLKLLKICIVRISFIVAMFILALKFIDILNISDGIPFALIVIGIFMMITNLNRDIRYLVNKYITYSYSHH
jgi:hypothetical protein